MLKVKPNTNKHDKIIRLEVSTDKNTTPYYAGTNLLLILETNNVLQNDFKFTAITIYFLYMWYW